MDHWRGLFYMFQDDDSWSNDHDVISSQEKFESPLNESLWGHEIEELSQCPKRGLWFFPRYDDHSPPCSSLDNQDNVNMDEQSISLCSHYAIRRIYPRLLFIESLWAWSLSSPHFHYKKGCTSWIPLFCPHLWPLRNGPQMFSFPTLIVDRANLTMGKVMFVSPAS